MKKYPIQIKPFGENAIVVEWQSTLDSKVFETIVAFKNNIIHEDISDFIIAYNSLTLTFFRKIDVNFWKIYLQTKYDQLKAEVNKSPNFWKIPVCFEPEFSTDLENLAKLKKSSQSLIIEMYCSTTFTLSFYGFQPGFPYLSNLPKELATPRKEFPQKVVAGSVAIGGEQTGIYPVNSLGGWHVIGNTPISLFNVENTPPCFISSGDIINFYPITFDEYQNINYKFDAQIFDINSLKA